MPEYSCGHKPPMYCNECLPSNTFSAVYSPPSMLDLQNRIEELNGLVDLLRAQMRDQNMRTRDRFAMAALTGMLSHDEWTTDAPKKVAEAAYRHADAMMERRSVKEDGGGTP